MPAVEGLKAFAGICRWAARIAEAGRRPVKGLGDRAQSPISSGLRWRSKRFLPTFRAITGSNFRSRRR